MKRNVMEMKVEIDNLVKKGGAPELSLRKALQKL
jgi:hypothetical protein